MNDYQRIFLWAIPRSLSTAVFRAMENRSNMKVVLEPFSKAYYFGEERISQRYLHQPIEKNATFRDIKKELDELKKEKSHVFVKDMAYYILSQPNALSLIPEGYQHTFLLRDPFKAIESLYRMSTKPELTGWHGFDPSEVGLKELWELYEVLCSRDTKPPLVLDADDLISDPEGYLQMYCNGIGLEYETSMLSWDEPEKSVAYSNEWYPWFEAVLNSKTIQKPKKKTRQQQSLELPDFILECIEENMVYYENFSLVKANNR